MDTSVIYKTFDFPDTQDRLLLESSNPEETPNLQTSADHGTTSGAKIVQRERNQSRYEHDQSQTSPLTFALLVHSHESLLFQIPDTRIWCGLVANRAAGAAYFQAINHVRHQQRSSVTEWGRPCKVVRVKIC
jgi:hypothetical protein